MEHLNKLPDKMRKRVEMYLERNPDPKYEGVVHHLVMHYRLAQFWEKVPWISWRGLDGSERLGVKSYADNPGSMSPHMVEFILREPNPCRFLDFGAGTGCVSINLAARGYDVVATEMNSALVFALALACVEHDVYVDIRRTMNLHECLEGGFDEACFSRTFYTRQMAQENLGYARALRDDGVKVWIGSDSIAMGLNAFVKLEPGEMGYSFGMPFPGHINTVNRAFVLEKPHAG